MDRGAWLVTVHRVAKSRIRLKRPSMHKNSAVRQGKALMVMSKRVQLTRQKENVYFLCSVANAFTQHSSGIQLLDKKAKKERKKASQKNFALVIRSTPGCTYWLRHKTQRAGGRRRGLGRGGADAEGGACAGEVAA